MAADNENIEKRLTYVCKAGNEINFAPAKGENYKKSYPNLIVYHPEKVPLGLFPNCKECKYGEMGLSFGLSEGGEIEEPKANLIIYCKIWQLKEKKIKKSVASTDT